MKPIHVLAAAALLMPAATFAQTDLPVGEPVDQAEDASENGEPGVGDTYLRETHGDWDIRCTIVAEDQEFCHMFQLLLDENDNSVASLRIAPLAEPEDEIVALGELTAPLETALPPGVTIAVDSDGANRYPFAFCSEIGCHARLGLTEGDLTAFRRGNVANIELIPFQDPGSPVTLTASLSGFTAGYGALSAGE